MLIPTTAQFGRIDSENNHNNSPARNVELLLDGSLLPNVIYSDVAVGAFQHTQMNWRIVTCHAYARHKKSMSIYHLWFPEPSNESDVQGIKRPIFPLFLTGKIW